MFDAGLAAVFLLMIFAPCAIARRSERQREADDPALAGLQASCHDAVERAYAEVATSQHLLPLPPVQQSAPVSRGLSPLQLAADQADLEAMEARAIAAQANATALAAAARAAQARAAAAAELLAFAAEASATDRRAA